ncbi:MAG TPA: AbrB family transcriptional regulator [Anaeromyxobacteraceae bacterium]|nr:AbrB family transcriptional regulator [Anaeromyxobacteraceae bacterium]
MATDPGSPGGGAGRSGLRSAPRPLQWAALFAATLLGTFLLRAASVPAALLLGPMAAGIAIAASHGTIAVPRWPFLLAQGVVGAMIASRFSPDLAAGIARGWKLYLLVTAGVLAASSLLGWLLARWRVLPGTTAVWGSSPGAATSMVVMAEEYGADVRLVAFMQYLRVVLVALIASGVARLAVPGGATPSSPPWFGPVHGGRLAETLVLVLGGAALGRLSRIPAGALLVPFLLGSSLHLAGWLAPELPPWLLALSYALVGWTVGLRFTRDILLYAARALPRVLASILALIAACGLLAAALARLAGVDALTAYLATSPGGADSAAIIAASSGKADVPFVMALQMVRAIAVLFLGPPLARLVARRVGGGRADG